MSGKSFVAELRCHPDKRAEMIALQSELKALVHAREPDALVYELLQGDSDPDRFLVVATFRDDAAFEHHMGVDFHDRLVPLILACLAQEMRIEWFRSLGSPA